MTTILRSSYLQAARCLPVDRIPIWMMRQAGRYMQSYQALRRKHPFIELVRTPELAVEVTMQPIKAFGMDAAILFSDIAVIADALELGLTYQEGVGPSVNRPIQTEQDIDRLESCLDRVDYVFAAIKMVKRELKHTPLIGFAGAPFTIMTYLLKDSLSHAPRKCMQWILDKKARVHLLLDKLSAWTADYLSAQIEAGVDAIQIFESHSNLLSWSFFTDYALPYLKKVIEKLHNPCNVPVTIFGTSFSSLYPLLQDIGAQVISVDSRLPIRTLRRAIRPDIALQGNLDPYLLLAPKSMLEKEARAILESMANTRGFIFNLGHGVFPEVSEDNVKSVVDIVKNFTVNSEH
ncbi:MAG: uroporphyrinogen decarboxylase [Waddliaceae bacterium]